MEMSTRLFSALYKAIVGHACFYTAAMWVRYFIIIFFKALC